MAPPQQASPRPILTVRETTLVAPSTSTGAAPPECSLPLTFFDIFWLNLPPVERVFFYRLAADADVPAILSNLKASLSQALHAYYPLAGRLRLAPGTADRYEIHYQPGDGVTFTVAEYRGDVDVDELAVDQPREITRIAPLAPPLPKGGAVLALQATVMRRGLAIGMAVHHTACDGAASTRFLHTWAAAASAGAVEPPPPVIDRILVKDPTALYDVFVKAKPTVGEMDRVKTWEHRLLAGRRGAAPPRCSSLVATFGFMWSCHQRAKDDAGSTGGDPTYLLFPVDHRSRMKPPVPEEYLGNCVGIATHAAPMDQLAAAGASGLFVACTAVAAAIDEAVRGIGSPETVALWMHRVREAGVAGMWTVAGSPRFRVYEVDFGFGRPAKVEIVSVARTGAMAAAEGRSSRGGIEVGISLPAAGMQRFQKCFQDAIDWLHHQ
ncbi:hypothetical protein CFC21_053366 [Triticum aestivum]|uniref:Uncharacterized protein n=3 Tax=Triticum TaxID=4564 RepID=A0A9R1K7U2_WHEAT|nr:anthocyanidin 3-O-glucoside 6''-O-acyltransferase-like [Triticum dicoccoides]XP_044360617.1 anthocyanidin 3-O-glucoside 6''-O-acyltransferase-like [Triticum aestivum]KAF7044093.1 hypothetical protein CFC21_053364 [Triticum aestivum]KAF7044095.1 hypothetical protein CFC21_053366 [Triticum aestivum]